VSVRDFSQEDLAKLIMKPLLKSGVRFMLHQAGGLRLWRHAHRHGLRILTYHRFPANIEEQWMRQCEHIRKYYNPVSMTAAVAHLRSGKPFPLNSVVITADDGYRDLYWHAYPVLTAWKIPAIIYVATDFVDGKDWLWWDKLEYAIQHTKAKWLAVESSRGHSVQFPLESPEQRSSVYNAVGELFLKEPAHQRLRAIEDLLTDLEVRLPAKPPAQKEPLCWSEIRRMAADGIEFGAHTLTHTILPQVESDEDLRSEIEGSKAALERELQTGIVHFSYPNGDWDARVKEAVRQAGFQTAVTVAPALNYPRQDPLLLHRIGMEPDLPGFYFRERMAAFHI
jgi:peptidoglycan/xylan/chitin deacetylase (PgdA/CDA1 family)